MRLMKVGQYILAKGLVTQLEISQHLQIEPHVVAHMIQYWVRKGFVQSIEDCSSCAQSCGGCQAKWQVMYRWQENTPEQTNCSG